MNAIDKLLQQAVQLPVDQQLTLAHRLLEASEPSASEEIEQAWDSTIRERIARYDQGLSRARPAGEVLTDLDRKLGA